MDSRYGGCGRGLYGMSSAIVHDLFNYDVARDLDRRLCLPLDCLDAAVMESDDESCKSGF
jgi:hypothetical protein